MPGRVVITGVGMVTPLGRDPAEVLRRLKAGESAVGPMPFDTTSFTCQVGARVHGFQPQDFVSESKMVRLMNRDAQMAVAAAHLALQDARIRVGADYQPQEIGLFGATGLVGLPMNEVAPLAKQSVDDHGQFNLGRFGRDGLRSISPLLSFKVLSNMPVCFISICENIQGPNAIYTPWEGQGAQAIAAGVRLLQSGQACTALVGGCDVKTHELAFIALEQLGLFQSWRDAEAGLIPGEGATFLVLEDEKTAQLRGTRAYARIAGIAEGTVRREVGQTNSYAALLRELFSMPRLDTASFLPVDTVVGGADADDAIRQAEIEALTAVDLAPAHLMYPKACIGNLFAAAAALQVGVGAMLAQRSHRSVLANCFGHGSQQAAFVLERV